MMNVIKKNIFSFLILVPIISLLAFSCSAKKNLTQTPTTNTVDENLNTNNLVAEDSVQIFFQPELAGHPGFTRLISTAQKKINMAMFRITEESDVTALINAAKKNKVKIRIILDREQTLISVPVQKIKAELIKAGIQVKLSTKGFSITHEKSMTVDDNTALISTINLTKGFKTTRDIGIISRDQNIIREFNSVFETDWINADNNQARTPPLTVKQLVWSPLSANTKLNSLVLEAQKTIELYVENFTDMALADSLIKSAQSGVKVRIITPLCSLNPNPLLNVPVLKKLLKNKIQVKVMKNPATFLAPYTHAKSIVVDAKKSYVGSINFSLNSLNKAREVGIIFYNIAASKKIIEKFNSDWINGIDLPNTPTLEMCY